MQLLFGITSRAVRLTRMITRVWLWGPILFAMNSLAFGLAASTKLLRSPKTRVPPPSVTPHASVSSAAAAAAVAAASVVVSNDKPGRAVRSERTNRRAAQVPLLGLSRMSLGGLLGDIPFLTAFRNRPAVAQSTAAAHTVLLHFHGGGFVAQSSDTHQHYLRLWANATQAVVASVDYTLGPYPQGMLECFMVYKWVVDGGLGTPLSRSLMFKCNCALSGFVPSHIILSGDSAGGNLSVAITLKAIIEGVRVPDGLYLFYPAIYCYTVPTPSRIMFSNDPVIPRVFLSACVDAYLPHLKHNRAALAGAFLVCSKSFASRYNTVVFRYFRIAQSRPG